METLLVIALLLTIGYIMYLESQPKTDAERKRRDEMDERMREVKALQKEKMSGVDKTNPRSDFLTRKEFRMARQTRR